MSAAERECHRPRDPRCSACGLFEGPPRAAYKSKWPVVANRTSLIRSEAASCKLIILALLRPGERIAFARLSLSYAGVE